MNKQNKLCFENSSVEYSSPELCSMRMNMNRTEEDRLKILFINWMLSVWWFLLCEMKCVLHDVFLIKTLIFS